MHVAALVVGLLIASARKSASTAALAGLALIYVDQFQHAQDAANNLVELKTIRSWQPGTFIEKSSWAAMPGGDKSGETGVAQPPACSAT